MKFWSGESVKAWLIKSIHPVYTKLSVCYHLNANKIESLEVFTTVFVSNTSHIDGVVRKQDYCRSNQFYNNKMSQSIKWSSVITYLNFLFLLKNLMTLKYKKDLRSLLLLWACMFIFGYFAQQWSKTDSFPPSPLTAGSFLKCFCHLSHREIWAILNFDLQTDWTHFELFCVVIQNFLFLKHGISSKRQSSDLTPHLISVTFMADSLVWMGFMQHTSQLTRTVSRTICFVFLNKRHNYLKGILNISGKSFWKKMSYGFLGKHFFYKHS